MSKREDNVSPHEKFVYSQICYAYPVFFFFLPQLQLSHTEDFGCNDIIRANFLQHAVYFLDIRRDDLPMY